MSKPKLVIRLLVTLTLVVLAVVAAIVVYRRYVEDPWTRDGMVKAEIVNIAPEVGGKVVEIFVVPNQFVNKGAPIFTIDQRDYLLAVDQANVALEQARQNVISMEADIVAAEAEVLVAEAAVTTAKSNVEVSRAQVSAAEGAVIESGTAVESAEASIRSAKAAMDESVLMRDRAQVLAEKRAGSVEDAEIKAATVIVRAAELDSAHANHRGYEAGYSQAEAGLVEAEASLAIASNSQIEAEAQLTSARAKLAQARAKLGTPGEGNVQILQAKNSLADAELALERTRLFAPANGYVTNFDVKPGDFASPGTPLLAFVKSETFRVDAYFKETQLRHIALGDRMIVTLMAHPDQELTGVVESIGHAIAPPNIATTEGTGGLVPVVQPTFEWIRLAQRVPVRVRLEKVPEGIQLISGTTASVSVVSRASN